MTKEERNLIIKSNICDENENLKKILRLFKGSIKVKDLWKIKNIDVEVYNLIKTRDAVEEMKNSSSKEWAPKQYMGKIKKPCELCGNTKSEYKTTILNRINNNVLLVGTRCIHKFSEINKDLYGMTIYELERIVKKNPAKLDRIVYFNKICPYGKNIFSMWQNKYNEFEISFPNEYDDEFSNILKKGKRIYSLYINGKIDQNELKNFNSYMKEFEYLYNKCKKFHDDNKNNKYICTKKIEKFLLDRGLKITIEHIKRNGKITQDIAKYIYHIDFIKRFKDNIRKMFLKYRIQLKEINNMYIKCSYEYEGFDPILLDISLQNFSNNFSNIFYNLNINNLTKTELFNLLMIDDNYNNVYDFLGILNYILRGTSYNFYINERFYEKQQIELHKNNTKQYVIVKLNDILKKYMYVFYLSPSKIKLNLLDDIELIKNWTNEEEKEKYKIGDISKEWATD